MTESKIKYIVEAQYGEKWYPGFCEFPTIETAKIFLESQIKTREYRIVQIETIRKVIDDY